jgi:hypothetical protein
VLLILGVGVVASSPLLTSAATTSGTDLTAQALKERQEVGLPTITETPAVVAAANAMLYGGNPQSAFTANGGTGTLVTATVPKGAALANDKLKVAVFDPRLTALAVFGLGDRVVAAAALNPSLPFSAPVLAGKLVYPGVAGSIAVLVPPGSGTIPKISLERDRGKQLVTIGTVATGIAGANGAVLIALKGQDQITGPQIGYGLTYTLKYGSGHDYTVETVPTPKVLIKRPFVAGPGFKGADKRAFLRYVHEMPAEARKVVNILEGAVTVSVLANTAPLCGFQTSCAGLDPSRGYFLVVNRGQLHNQLGHFIVTHETGHLVDFLGLDQFSHEAFKNLFSKSRSWKSCFSLAGYGCTPFPEIFADQFAFFSTNAHGIQSGYNDPRLASRAAYSKLLAQQWAFRPPEDSNPLAGFGPLAKSFSKALHSAVAPL